MKRALIFDLDDTLVVDDAAAAAAFEATARFARSRTGIDAGLLVRDARACARDLWSSESPAHAYCGRIGMSSWEGLWCQFEGDGAEVRLLRRWAPTYRRETWALALAKQGIEAPDLAADLGERFGVERRARNRVYDDVADALDLSGETHALGLLTNGAACLQREKLDASGLDGRFDATVVSADLGVGKPDPRVFDWVLAKLGVAADRAVMVGDSLARDVNGARTAGIAAVWVNRLGDPRPGDRDDLVEISSFAELAMALELLPRRAAFGRSPSDRPRPRC